jgi:hypothetical protein
MVIDNSFRTIIFCMTIETNEGLNFFPLGRVRGVFFGLPNGFPSSPLMVPNMFPKFPLCSPTGFQ